MNCLFKKLRSQAGHTIEQAAAAIGKSKWTVIRIEKGRMNDNQAAIYTAAYRARLSEEGKV